MVLSSDCNAGRTLRIKYYKFVTNIAKVIFAESAAASKAFKHLGLMYNSVFLLQYGLQSMDAEHLNQIANRLADLAERNNALRGYL